MDKEIQMKELEMMEKEQMEKVKMVKVKKESAVEKEDVAVVDADKGAVKSVGTQCLRRARVPDVP